MKKNRLLVILLITLVLQSTIFYLLDWRAGQLINPSYIFGKSYRVNAELNQADQLSLSYNNKFLAYLSQDSLEVIDLTTNKNIFSTQDFSGSGSKLRGYQWLPDRNTLVYLLDNSDEKSAGCGLYSINFSTGSSEDTDLKPKLEREINFSIEKIIKIEISTYTNNLFILYEDSHQNNQLIKMDIMKTVNRVDHAGEKVINIAVSNKFGNLYLESNLGMAKTISSEILRERETITNNAEDILLACQDDKVFIGRVSDHTLLEIKYYQETVNDSAKKWLSIWQGKIPYDQPETSVSADQTILIKTKDRLDIIYLTGEQKTINMNDKTIVLSPTGNKILDISPMSGKFYYTWRSI